MKTYDSLIRSLLLIRLGQELGTTSPIARAVHDLLEVLAAVAGNLAR